MTQETINKLAAALLKALAKLMGQEPIEVLAKYVEDQDELNRLADLLIEG